MLPGQLSGHEFRVDIQDIETAEPNHKKCTNKTQSKANGQKTDCQLNTAVAQSNICILPSLFFVGLIEVICSHPDGTKSQQYKGEDEGTTVKVFVWKIRVLKLVNYRGTVEQKGRLGDNCQFD